MRDPAGVVGRDAMSTRRARGQAAAQVTQTLHEAHCAHIRAGVLDAAGAYNESLISWERAHDAVERANGLAADPRPRVRRLAQPCAGAAARPRRHPASLTPEAMAS